MGDVVQFAEAIAEARWDQPFCTACKRAVHRAEVDLVRFAGSIHLRHASLWCGGAVTYESDEPIHGEEASA